MVIAQARYVPALNRCAPVASIIRVASAQQAARAPRLSARASNQGRRGQIRPLEKTAKCSFPNMGSGGIRRPLPIRNRRPASDKGRGSGSPA